MEYSETLLFENISEADCHRLLTCMKAQKRSFYAEEELYAFDNPRKVVGILLKGQASIVRYEYNGVRTILENLQPRSIFGEHISFAPSNLSCIAVVAQSDCEVLFLDYQHLTQTCQNACACHTRLIRNMLNLLSDKTRALSERVEVLSQRSIREKLLCYFMQLASQTGSRTFELPFTMIDFADFLSVNRSAMMRELGKMKEEGLIRIHRRTITLQ
jgi:CRP-like cAMP-binding protein